MTWYQSRASRLAILTVTRYLYLFCLTILFYFISLLILPIVTVLTWYLYILFFFFLSFCNYIYYIWPVLYILVCPYILLCNVFLSTARFAQHIFCEFFRFLNTRPENVVKNLWSWNFSVFSKYYYKLTRSFRFFLPSNFFDFFFWSPLIFSDDIYILTFFPPFDFPRVHLMVTVLWLSFQNSIFSWPFFVN